MAAVGIGFCGALTTYSTFGYETVRLAQDRTRFYAAVNVTTSILAGLGAAYCGLAGAAGGAGGALANQAGEDRATRCLTPTTGPDPVAVSPRRRSGAAARGPGLLALLLGYLALPMDLIPDFIPVLGWPSIGPAPPRACAPCIDSRSSRPIRIIGLAVMILGR